MDIDKEKEFVELIESNKGIIYKVCLLYSDDSESHHDLFQEVVVNLWRAYPRFRGECKVQTWIYRISLNTCVSFLRKSKSKLSTLPISPNIEALAEESDFARVKELYKMIDSLNKIDKALVLLYLEDKSHDEISQIVGISRSNVAVRLFRIKERLKNMSNN
ncbi:MAG: sigma-70 family RNA polymerase sigma factor [Rikenellaceae bacterium]|nr:sigma-70 family RNA polymerase sigma factor [Rikenellaceae bacterium]